MTFSSLFTLSVLIGCTIAAPAEPILLSRSALDQTPNPATELSRRAQAVNYNQNYVASGANVQYSPNQSTGKFTVSYNTQQDFVVGLGWKPGNSEYEHFHLPITSGRMLNCRLYSPVTYSGSFSASSGVGILALYGWT
jgi:endo-1,4-beta-xylanase